MILYDTHMEESVRVIDCPPCGAELMVPMTPTPMQRLVHCGDGSHDVVPISAHPFPEGSK